MLKNPSIQVQSINKQIDDTHVVFQVGIYNPEDRTIYAYAVPRRILYDNATKELTLCLHDKHFEDKGTIGVNLKEPKIIELESKAETILRISLLKVIKRLKAAAEPGSDRIELLKVYEAETVTVEIAHQDTPFYYNAKIDNVKQLKDWGRSITKAEIIIKPGRNTEKKK